MKINRNMSAVVTNKQLLRTENRLAASMERLSSGFKINKPGDNPSEMAISNKMKAQIRALDQSKDNTQDGISVMQIADGALNETANILQRIRELAIQAANGTNSYDDRKNIQAEVDQLVQEVDRISRDTEYNTKSLLDGSSDTRMYTEGGEISRVRVSGHVAAARYGVTLLQLGKEAQFAIPIEELEKARTKANNAGQVYSGTISVNGFSIDVNSNMSDAEFISTVNRACEQNGLKVQLSEDQKELNIHTVGEGSRQTLSVSYTESWLTATGTDGNKRNGIYEGVDAKIKLGDNFSNSATVQAEGNRIVISDEGGFSLDFMVGDNMHPAGEEYINAGGDKVQANGEFGITVADYGRMIIQTGGNENQTIKVRIPEVSAKSLYLDIVDMRFQGGAEAAIDIIDAAIQYTSEVRSRIGSYQNRLEYNEKSLSATNENMTGAYSTLIDTDMAKEMTEYTQLTVLSQASISVLSQANDLPQQVLSLLRQ